MLYSKYCNVSRELFLHSMNTVAPNNSRRLHQFYVIIGLLLSLTTTVESEDWPLKKGRFHDVFDSRMSRPS